MAAHRVDLGDHGDVERPGRPPRSRWRRAGRRRPPPTISTSCVATTRSSLTPQLLVHQHPAAVVDDQGVDAPVVELLAVRLAPAPRTGGLASPDPAGPRSRTARRPGPCRRARSSPRTCSRWTSRRNLLHRGTGDAPLPLYRFLHAARNGKGEPRHARPCQRHGETSATRSGASSFCSSGPNDHPVHAHRAEVVQSAGGRALERVGDHVDGALERVEQGLDRRRRPGRPRDRRSGHRPPRTPGAG